MHKSGVRRSLSLLAALGVILALPSFRAPAQEGTEGTIVVSVEDSSGAVVPDATLTLISPRTNDTRVAQTSGAGTYSFVNLPIGQYKLIVERSGFATRVYSSVVVESSQLTSLEVKLSVGTAAQTVQVNSETAPILDTTSNEIGTVITGKQIQDLLCLAKIEFARFWSLSKRSKRAAEAGLQCELGRPIGPDFHRVVFGITTHASFAEAFLHSVCAVGTVTSLSFIGEPGPAAAGFGPRATPTTATILECRPIPLGHAAALLARLAKNPIARSA
jgi:hypothetical protein